MAHQADAVEKLAPIRVGALFMEMGTGKSRTAIELAIRRQGRLDRVVWFCPVSLKETVAGEILKHTDTDAGQIHVFDHKSGRGRLPDVFWYVAGIESMSASARVILAVNEMMDDRTMVILDESSYIKGHRSARTRHITHVGEKARYRVILTGTPISQGVVDLFAQMRFLSPKILGYRSFYSFAFNHLEYSEKYPGMIVRAHNTEHIAERIKPYVYQVTKDECLDLPEKTYTTMRFSLTAEQADAYAEAKEEILSDEAFEEFDSIVIFRLFTALQQIACGFWRRRDPETGDQHMIEFGHYRLDCLMEAVEEIPVDEKIIIWAKFEKDILGIDLALRRVYGQDASEIFYGKMSERERSRAVKNFRKAARFFVATPSCGGHGLTLNEARYVIFYSNGFKYAERIQAEDRCHRIGQTRSVHYIDIVARCGIDERIEKALSKKGDVVDEFKAEIEKVKRDKSLRERLMEDL